MAIKKGSVRYKLDIFLNREKQSSLQKTFVQKDAVPGGVGLCICRIALVALFLRNVCAILLA